MFKKIVPVFLLLSLTLQLPAGAQVIQDHSDYQDLFDLYVFGDYEKCLKKALKYTENDKKRRDAEPFLFASVCYLKIHKNPENFDPDIEDRPLKEALKYGYRFIRRDDLLFLQDLNKEFLTDLRNTALKEALLQLQLDNNRKAAYFLKYVGKLNPDDYAAKLAMGISQVLGRNKYEGQRNMRLAYEMIYEELDDNHKITMKEDAGEIMGEFLEIFLKHWEKKQNKKKYLQTLSMAHLLLGSDSEFWADVN